MKYFFSLALMMFFFSGCASVNSLPQSASEANFQSQLKGKTGWSKYEGSKFFKDIDMETCFSGAQAGLTGANFTIKKAEFEKLFILGEHGMTLYDWNIVAGVYLKQETNGCLAKALVQGSKDIGIKGDATGSSWIKDIFRGMQEYILKNKK